MSGTHRDHIFLGRKSTLELFKRRVGDLKEGYRQNIALVGPPSVGKSALLEHFVVNFDDHDVVPIYLDLEHKDFDYFVTKFITSLIYHFAKSRHLPLHDDLNCLIEDSKKYIPHTVEIIRAIQRNFEKGKISDCFLGILTLLEVFTNETEKFCILILDEFQEIENFLIDDAFQKLGKKIMTQKRCLYIVASSYPAVAQKIITEKLSLLFGNFETVELEFFDPVVAQEFIDNYLSGLRIVPELRNFLADFSGGHPLYLQLLCREIKTLAAIHHQQDVYLPLLGQAVENTIFDRWGVISRHFDLLIVDLCQGKNNRAVAGLMISMANGRHKFDEIMADVGLAKIQLSQRLGRLMELGIVIRNGNYYCFKDRLFKYWVKYIYQKRLKNIETSPDRQRKQLREEFNKSMDEYQISSQKDFSSRVVELLHCFDNESFQLNGRKYKLPAFRDIVPVKMKTPADKTGINLWQATTDESDWFIIMKKENFLEQDLTTILTEVKKTASKSERGVIISLKDIDQNARVKALQERFWIWNGPELNALLTLFDKPYII